MAIFYSKTERGFFDDEYTTNLPEDAVSISYELHKEMLNGQSQGKVIMWNAQGLPVLADQPNVCQDWDENKAEWVCDPVKKAEMKAQQQEQVWEAIKQKRYDNLRQGVYVKSVGKWFQTDDATRLQYLTLRTLSDAAFPLKEPWKTMDNTYLPKEKCTKALFEEIVMQTVADETADFHNAERHRLAMLQAEDPLQYDFSKGWTANYFSTAPSALVAAEEAEETEEKPKAKKPAKKGEE